MTVQADDRKASLDWHGLVLFSFKFQGSDGPRVVPEAALNEPCPKEHIGNNRLNLPRAPSRDP